MKSIDQSQSPQTEPSHDPAATSSISPISPIRPINEGELETNSKLNTQNSTFTDISDHALTGKIAHLPDSVREELNQRLLDGQPSTVILPWLNELPSVKEILAAQFSGQTVTKQNLSHWRQSGYQRWLQQRQSINSAKKLGKYAKEFTDAAGGRFAPAVTAVSAAKIFEYLDKVNADEVDPTDLARLGMVSSALLKIEQHFARIDIARERIRQGDDRLLLTRDKHQRDVTAVGMRLLRDARAKDIEAAPIDNHEKIELLGYRMFDRFWKFRPLPSPEDPPNPPLPSQ